MRERRVTSRHISAKLCEVLASPPLDEGPLPQPIARHFLVTNVDSSLRPNARVLDLIAAWSESGLRFGRKLAQDQWIHGQWVVAIGRRR